MKNTYIILFIFLIKFSNSFALIKVDITRGNLNPLPIAVSPLSSDKNTNQELKRVIKK